MIIIKSTPNSANLTYGKTIKKVGFEKSGMFGTIKEMTYDELFAYCKATINKSEKLVAKGPIKYKKVPRTIKELKTF